MEAQNNGKLEKKILFSNYYLKLPLSESIGNQKPKYIGDGEIVNSYMSTRTNSLILEMFSVKKLEPSEINDKLVNGIDQLSFVRWVYRELKDMFELNEFLSIDYANTRNQDYYSTFYYSEVLDYSVVKLQFANLFIF